MKGSSLITALKILGLFTLLILLSGVVQAQETGFELWSYKTGGEVCDVSVSSNGSYVAAGSDDNKVYLFNRDGELLWSYETEDLPFGVSISSNDSYIVASSRAQLFRDERVYLFDHEGKLLQSYKIGRINDASESYDGLYIGDLSHDKRVCLFNQKGRIFWSYEGRGASAHTTSISASSDGSYIAVPSSQVLFLFNHNGKELWSYTVDDWWVSVSVSPDGSYIAAASHDKKMIYLFNRKGRLLWSYDIGSPVKSVAVSSDGSYVAAGSDKVYLFNREGEQLWSYETGGGVHEVSISPDGTYIAAGSRNKVYLFVRLEKLAKSVIEKLAKGVIEEAKKVVESEKAEGINVAEAEALLPQAEQSFSSGEYARSMELAKQAEDRAETVATVATVAKNAIDEVGSVISLEKSRGFYSTKAETLFSQAEQAFGADEYTKARGLAYRAKALALDIDGDGVPNNSDFAPTIKNVYVYGVAVSLTLASVSFAGVKIRRRKYERKVREYRAKIEHWEREGYEVSEFRERWFK